MSSLLYFDNHLQTKPSPSVFSTIMEAQKEHWASASAPYKIGEKGLLKVNEEALKIYQLVDASEKDSLIFCSSGIDAIEKMFLSFLFQKPKEKILRILSIQGEESFLSFYLDNLSKDFAQVERISLNEKGQVDLEAFKKALEKPVDLVTLSHANGLTGVIHPIDEISKICQSKKIPLHVDVSNLLGKLFFSLQKTPIDYLTFSGEMIHGPKAGALFIRSHHEASPWITGGEKDAFLAHKIDVPTFLGFAKSCEETRQSLDHFSLEAGILANRFEQKIKEKIPDLFFPLSDSQRLPNVSLIGFPNVPSEPFLFYLNQENLCATFGRGFYQHLAKILQFSHVDPEISWTVLSFSLSRMTDEKEIDEGAAICVSMYEKAKRIFKSL